MSAKEDVEWLGGSKMRCEEGERSEEVIRRGDGFGRCKTFGGDCDEKSEG